MKDHSDTVSAATRGHCGTMFVALELSGKVWLTALWAPDKDRISRHGLAAGDAAALLQLIGRVRARAARRLGRPMAVVSCYEAGRDGFWLHRLLASHGIDNQVMDPASLPVDRRARRVKTDRIDVDGLLRALMAWHRGEARVCSMVRVPSVEEEDARRLTRERESLVKERLRHTNRIKGLLASQGIYHFEPLGADRRRALDPLVSGDGRPLGERLKAELGRQLGRLEGVCGMLREVEAERDRRAQAAARRPRPDEPLALLMRLRSLGPETASVLATEVFYRRFDNRRQVAAYVGLAPSPYASGATAREQGISKAGNRRARRIMVELAWLWLRHQPESALSRWYRSRVGDTKGRMRRITIIALARKLLVALWRYVETGMVPAGANLKG